MYIEIREPASGKLLCRYDPERRLLEHRRRGVVTITDLAALEPEIPERPERPAPQRHHVAADHHEAL